MPDPNQYNLTFRPRSYRVYDDPKKKVRATVKGTVRRAVAEAALDGDPAGPTDPFCFDESLAEQERALRSSFHPMLMGGEYLPDLLAGEVEIARVEYQSVTGDVVSIRARWDEVVIRYRIVDEYHDGGDNYADHACAADQPLSLGELIGLIDAAGLVLPVIEMNHEGGSDVEELVDFATVSSAFYPELDSWYAEVVAEWAAPILEEIRRQKEEDEAREREWEAGREQREREEAELKERLRLAPAKSPYEFPAGLPIGELSVVDREQLNKWVQTLEGIQPARLWWGPPHHPFGGFSPKRYLHVQYTVDGRKWTISIGDHNGKYPPLAEALRRFEAEVPGFGKSRQRKRRGARQKER